MKKFTAIICAIMALVVISNATAQAQTKVSPGKTVSFEKFSKDAEYKDAYTASLASVKGKKYGAEAKVTGTVKEAYSVTDFPSKCGKKVTELVVVYTDADDKTCYQLFGPDKDVVVQDDEIIGPYGDCTEAELQAIISLNK